MDVTSSSGAAARTAAASAASSAETATAAETAATDFQTFLTLLTTQLRNQDPLKPTESTEFVAQLASFSAVEQQVRANDRLEQIHAALGGGASAGLAAWIGREVRAPAQAAWSGVPIAIETVPMEGADAATLVVTDDFGKVVARRSVDPAAASLTWDGADALGQALPYGRYSFAIESSKGGETLGTEQGQVFATVSEVRIEDGKQILVLDGGGRVGVDAVTAIR